MTLCACVCIRFRKVQCSLWDYLLSVGTRQRERNMNRGQREAPGGSEDPTERTQRLHQSPLSARTSHHRRCSTSSFTSRRPSVHPLSASQHLKCVSAMCLCRLCTVCKLFTFILSASSSKVCVRVYIRHILSSPLIKSQTLCWDSHAMCAWGSVLRHKMSSQLMNWLYSQNCSYEKTWPEFCKG